MSNSELQLVEAILERAAPDPRGFADRVVQQAVERLTSVAPVEQERPVAPVYDATSQEFSDRNVLLAAALGACECWAAEPDCPVCSGQGSPGWTVPDTALFAEYVQPAVTRSGAPAEAPKV